MNPNRRPSTAIAIAIAIAGAAEVADAGLADSAWPMFQHDAQHSGRTDVAGPQGNVKIAWKQKTRSRLKGTVSVGTAGQIFVPNGKNPLSAFDAATGAELWQSSNHNGGHADRSSPAVSDTGVVYVGARDNDLWACNVATGQVNWRYHVPHDGDVTTPPTIASDGTIYMGSEALGAGWLYAMDPDGLPKWTIGGNVVGDNGDPNDAHVVLRGSFKNASPALSKDESTVFVSTKRDAIAIRASDGYELWRAEIADKGFGSRHPNYAATVSNDGSKVYFPSKEGLWALNPTNGSSIWLFVPENGEEIKSAAAIGADGDGTIYIGASKKKTKTFYALNPLDGSIKWKHQHTNKGKFSNNQAAIGSDGKVYVGLGKFVFCFDGQGDGSGGSRLLWSLPLAGKIDAGVIIGKPEMGDDPNGPEKGVLYVGAGKNLWKITD